MSHEKPSRLVALWCWYHGGGFRGYQSQVVGPTVQDTIEAALRSAGFSRNPVASGRTDLGVHARMQVLSLRVVEGVPPDEVAAQLNAQLPPTVGVACSRRAHAKFHAGYSATGKEYRYRLLLKDDARWEPCAWRVDVDIAKVAEALSACVGTRNFWAFHEKSSAVCLRTVREATVHQVGDGLFEARVVGDGFAKYMVRFLVGAAVGVAQGQLDAERYLAALAEARPFIGLKAPGRGLVLWEVKYAPEVDPFSAAERASPPGLPGTPPFALP